MSAGPASTAAPLEASQDFLAPPPSRWGKALAIVANLVPLVGVLAWGWDIGYLMALFWAENVVLGLINIGRMLVAMPGMGLMWALKLFFIPFFAVHFGGFCAVHGLFVRAMFTGGGDGADWPWTLMAGFAAQYPGFTLALAAIGAVHLVHTALDFIGTGAYRTANPVALMFQPYGRIVVLHVTLLAGGALVAALGAPIWALVLMVVLKSAIDVGLWTFGSPQAKPAA